MKDDERMRRSTNAGRGGWGGGITRAAHRRSQMRFFGNLARFQLMVGEGCF